MIYAELKHIISPDVDDPSSYYPENPENFGFLLQLIVGPKNEAGEESFQVMVCTPMWLSHHFAKDEIIQARHYLIVFEYDYQRLISWINQYLQSCKGKTWREVAEKVSRISLWEFEDYQEYKG